MLWLIWQIWIFLFIAFGLGLALGWRLWSASGETGKALRDAQEQIGQLQRENDSLTRLVAQSRADRETASQAKPAAAASKTAAAKPASEPVKTGAATKAASTPKSKSPKPKTASPKPAAKSAPAKPDDLTELKGLGPKASDALKAEGVTTFAQIAAWTNKDIERWDEKLTARGRIKRDDWVGQAKAKTG